MDLGLKNKVALVLGSSQGLGYAVAQALIAEGATVILSSRSREKLEVAQKRSGAADSVVTDLQKPLAGGEAVREVLRKYGRIDVLVCNAGGPPKGTFESITPEAWQAGFQSLWLSVVDSVQAALPSMKERRWGRVLLITSVAAAQPLPGLTVSNGLRAGLTGLVKSASNEIAPHGITINALLPAHTRTERLAELGLSEQKMIADIPAGRLGEPEDLGALAAFLASQRAGFITGQAIACDGGFLRGH